MLRVTWFPTTFNFLIFYISLSSLVFFFNYHTRSFFSNHDTMSDIQATQDSIENSPPGSPAQSYLTIFPSDSASLAGIALNSNAPNPNAVTRRNTKISPLRIIPSGQDPPNQYHHSLYGSAISTISDLTDAPSSLLTPTYQGSIEDNRQIPPPEHFLPVKKACKSWIWAPIHGEEYLARGKWRWRCNYCKNSHCSFVKLVDTL